MFRRWSAILREFSNKRIEAQHVHLYMEHPSWCNIHNVYLITKKRSRITVYIQLYLTFRNSIVFRLYICSHHQAGCPV